MPRPRKSNDTREALLSEGGRVLSSQGYHGTGIKEILDAVNVPKGSFYNYFESKEAFVATIIDRYIDVLLGRFDRHIARSKDDPVTIMKKAYEFMLAEMEREGAVQGCLVGNMAAEIGASSPRCQAALRRGFERWHKTVEGLIERGQREGAIRDDLPAKAMASVFWNAWEGGLLRMKVEGNGAAARETIHLMLDGLFAPPKRS